MGADVPRLRAHRIVLRGPRVILRPLTERDWPALLRWNRDPRVLRWNEGPDNPPYDLAQVQRVYGSVSQTAFCFIIKAFGRDLGECWLQELNVEELLRRHRSEDCRRIDIMIGEPAFWNRGIGNEAIALLLRFAFDREHATRVFAVIDAANERSLRAFEKAGFAAYESAGADESIRYLTALR